MDQLVDFINHGMLPFAGRSESVAELTAFWRSTIDAQELRVALLRGEAGVGKSRLLDAVAAAVEEAGGTTIRVRLIPETGTSIIPLLSQALWYDERLRRLVRGEPNAAAGAVTAWLRRVARLRPTLLVIEDIHLLGGELASELAALLDAVADDTLAVICSARPIALAVRGVLERYLTEELPLAGLAADAVAEIWSDLFGRAPDAALRDAVAEVTGGNPLALRSALRAAIKSGALEHNTLSGHWQPVGSIEELVVALRRSTGWLAEGMTAGLHDDERRAAEHFAALGEVFALETAQGLLPEAERLVNLLVFKGILVPSPTPPPALPGRASTSTPLAFTHSLVHQYFAEHSPLLLPRTIEIIAGDAPLYSTQPLERVARDGSFEGLDTDVLSRYLDRGLAIARQLDLGPTWNQAMDVWRACSRFLERTSEAWAPDTALRARAQVANSRLLLMRRFAGTPEYGTLVDEALALTATSTPDIADLRLATLRWQYVRSAARDAADAEHALGAIEAHVQTYPDLRFTRAYLVVLRSAAEIAARIPDVPMLRRIERLMNDLFAEPDMPAALRAMALQVVAPQFLILFDSPEEYAHRIGMLTEILDSAERADTQLFIRRLAFLESTGQMTQALRVSEEGIDLSVRLGMEHMKFQCALTRLCARGALGYDLWTIEDDAWRLAEAQGRGPGPNRKAYCAFYLTEVGLLRNDAEWTRSMLGRYGASHGEQWLAVRLLLDLDAGSLDPAMVAATTPDASVPADILLHRIATAILGIGGIDVDDAVEALGELLGAPILRTSELMIRTAARAIALTVAGSHARLRETAAAGLPQELEWLVERGLGGYLGGHIDRFGTMMSRRELAYWRERSAALREEAGAEQPQSPAGYRLSMIGAIAVTMPDGEIQTLRGARLRTVLGLLVAARMVSTPISNNEFCRLAAGNELDIDRARKTTNMAVVRLRESLGDEFIRTGSETHELNTEIVAVDLLTAHALVRQATTALRRRSLMLAFPAAMGALEITRGEVVFPGLYDEFFEAIREDFENRLRTMAIDVARALMSEQDHESAARLLRRAFEWMRDDEEIAELLREALEREGSRTDAQRVRLSEELDS